MDSKTRVLMALNHEKPDRVPFNFWMDRRLFARYEKMYGHHHWRVTHFDADVIESFPNLNFPTGPSQEHNGSNWILEPYFRSWDRAEDIQMPDPHGDRVYSTFKSDLQSFPDRAVFLNTITPWGVIAGMRTYENVYMDMIENPDQFKRLAGRIAEVMKVVIERGLEMGLDALYIQEDLAAGTGLTMSPDMAWEFCLDYAREFVDIARAYDKPVLFHSDGMILDLIEPLIELGVDAVNPLQHNLNNPREFKKRYGNRMGVYGGLDNCFIIPDGSPQQIRNHVAEVFEVLGKPDGALIMSTHDIPFETPHENIEAMVEAIKNCLY